MKFKSPKIQESNEQVQNRLRAQEENTRAIQNAVSDRTNAYKRRLLPRKSLVTGRAARAIV